MAVSSLPRTLPARTRRRTQDKPACISRLLQKRIAGCRPTGGPSSTSCSVGNESADGAIRPRDRRLDPPPLSFAQQQLWFLDRLAPSGWFYNESSALHLTHAVDGDALERALNDVVRRHDALRTWFGTVAGEPVQMIALDSPTPLVRIHLTSLPAAERRSEARRLASEDAQRPFDSARLPPIRAHLLREAERDYVLLLTMHHIVFDGWLLPRFPARVVRMLRGARRGAGPALGPLPIQYADYAVWQRRTLRGDALEQTVGYDWRTQLADLPFLELPNWTTPARRCSDSAAPGSR